MRDAEKTIGNIIDKAGVSIISSVDEAGFPNTKAMIPPRKREGIKHIYFTTNIRKPAYISSTRDFSEESCSKELWKFYRIRRRKK
jgi:general stress protein 26